MRNRVVKPQKTQETRRAICLAYIALGIVLVCLSACAPDVGIFAGGNWQSSGLQNKHVRVLAVDPNNAQTLYAGNTQGAIFVSTDAAQHWSARNRVLPAINALAFDTSGKKLYAATQAGIFVTTDAAQHWNLVGMPETGLPIDSYTALAFNLNAPHTIFAGTSYHGVLISKDDGKSWSNGGSNAPFQSITNLAFDPDAHQLWAATELGVYRSDDGGTTWRAFNSGLPANIIVYTVQPASVGGGAHGLIFAGTNHGFFLTQDAGAHWAPGHEVLAPLSVYQILVDFRQPGRVYIATNIDALRSNDNGQTWGTVGPGLPKHAPIYALALGATDYSQLYAVADDVYLFPGSSGGLSPTRFLPILLILLFFYLLYRLSARGWRRAREALKPERIIETPPSTPLDELARYNVVPRDKGRSNNAHSIDSKQEVSGESDADGE